MYDNGVFIFGPNILVETRRDVVSSLPLELSWKIFLYLDNTSLSNAVHTCKLWKRIIISNRVLRVRLKDFKLTIKMGSERRAHFYKANKKLLKRLMIKNYLPVAKDTVQSIEKTVIRSKRGGEDFVVYTKRYVTDLFYMEIRYERRFFCETFTGKLANET